MSDRHGIRLRGPWHFELLPADGAPGGTIRGVANMPCSWRDALPTEPAARVRWSRKFNGPTGVDPAHAVWLVFEQPATSGDVSLNGERLGTLTAGAERCEFDITRLLGPHNTLTADLEPPDSARQTLPLFATVHLEIRGPGALWRPARRDDE